MTDNRARRRAEEARAKMERNANRLRDAINERNEAAGMADRLRTLLFAFVREHGRVRVKGEHIGALTESDRVDFLQLETGDVMLEFKQG